MEYAELGLSGVRVSRLCLGTMQFGWTADEATSFAVLDAYVAAGGNFIDTADIYSRWVPRHGGGESERVIGRWLKARGRRDGLVIATKVRGRMWPGPEGEGLGYQHIIKAVEYSLERLGVETIDLYQAHYFDDEVPIEESLEAFARLIQQGKVRYIGCSNYDAERLAVAVRAARAKRLPPFVSFQPHHNLVHRLEFEAELQALCLQHGLAVIPYSPLAKGFLTGKYRKGGPRPEGARSLGVKAYLSDQAWAVLDSVRDIAAAHGVTPAAVALAWQLAQPAVTASIMGANSVAQLADQLPATDLRLAPDELARLDAASAGL